MNKRLYGNAIPSSALAIIPKVSVFSIGTVYVRFLLKASGAKPAPEISISSLDLPHFLMGKHR
jgi:hypothetical protein